ncbi:amp-binding protein : AMP-dependent synthetase and ligase OS=Sphaerobacter thermophilus (strain DSM 20745 / S 6022) GN=Sthe_0360 PE=4 SV=1: AMP-binding: AMP-binding_C [Gemmata massiliana]|uniref:AMP-dependent synthetase/ligase domain-containing protein n=1 Tax=Gemmata massiliana TaxID=1210884 RepID=A0A6P2D572_9BACT|nr:AMP-binding protein [Gemmata massiliana]VTR95595.1 amp-binding protein : AMP-dependent synthetase and ligase OS=Sphaerobacter thermophilus (strain DSM 20745 / S 6022) GN=Sthe_0360 PE=4 SV=1: AMP-binding: AMP-binding_C [Gemmata massiliana]
MSLPSYAHGASPVPLLGETIGTNLRRTVEQFGERDALVVRHQNFRATYCELWELVERAARGLISRGVKTGDRMGIWAPNRFEWVVLQYATARIGAILVNINPAYKAIELEYALNKSGVALLCLARGFRQTDYLAILSEVRDRCPALRAALVIDNDWNALLADADSVSEEQFAGVEGKLQFDDPVNIQYTSGTTGFPKGATLSHHNILNNAFFTAEGLGYTERDRVCVPVPFYHCFGMVLGNLACTTHGACIVVPAESFDPLAVLETVQQERCTSLYGVPTMFIAELNHPRFGEFDLSSLRTGITAGAPCPIEVMKQIQTRMHMREITNVCGMTETSPASTQTGRDDPLEKRVATVGRPFPHAEIKIIDPVTGAIVPRGVPGEQCTRGYMVMLGYWEDPDATARAIDSTGWMHTGDLAIMDDEGYVSIVGRLKDVIIRGGENVYPREVEEFLHTIPGVAEAQVIGVPCPKYGEEVMAWVRLRVGETLTGDDLFAACHGRIATYKIPRHWKFVDTFPMTVTGKVQKFRMRELATAELRGASA